ncbi:MAG: glycoside hydrolase family 18 protein [Verrucomicrobiales bacterium]
MRIPASLIAAAFSLMTSAAHAADPTDAANADADAAANAQKAPAKVLAGYLPSYRIDSVDAARLAGLTDLIYFGIEPPEDGTLPEDPIPAAALEKLRAIKKAVGCRVLVTAGGWGRSAHFPAIAADPAARSRFVEALASLCESGGFDGIDFDWEHPEGEAEMRSYAELLLAARDRFGPRGLLVTVAQAPWQDLGKAAYAGIDRVHLMSYDHGFPQATLEKSKADLGRVIGWGCPPEKIALGIPFYGRNAKGEAAAYKDLAASEGFDPTADEIRGYAFNSRLTAAAKVDLAFDRQLAGVMVWELGQDSGNFSILGAIQKRLAGRGPEILGKKPRHFR